jgi:hypothetical protein
MKNVMKTFGVLLITSVILASCGSGDNNEETKVDLDGLQGKYFKRLDGDAAIYFISSNELIRSYVSVSRDDVFSIKYKYSITGNELIIQNKDKSDPSDVNDKYIIYNNEVIMHFFEGKDDYPRGVSYRLSEDN